MMCLFQTVSAKCTTKQIKDDNYHDENHDCTTQVHSTILIRMFL